MWRLKPRLAGHAAAISLLLSGVALDEPLRTLEIGAPAPAFNATGADGRWHRLRDYAGKIVVLEWTSPVCPFTAMKYEMGAMQAEQRYARAHDVVWLSVDTAASDRSGFLTAQAARRRVASLHAAITAFLFDPDAHIARSFGAKVTPSFFIIDRNGKLAYQGAMDPYLGEAPGVHDDYIRAALADLDAGVAVRRPRTEARGCAIEY